MTSLQYTNGQVSLVRDSADGVTNLYSYAVGNILTNFGSGTLVQHDLAGNITNLQYSASRKVALYWNNRYELTEVKTNGVTAEKYDYDPLGSKRPIRHPIGIQAMIR